MSDPKPSEYAMSAAMAACEDIARAIDLAVAEEREACAKVAEAAVNRTESEAGRQACVMVALFIRARGEAATVEP